jgi:hypothetical protein
MLRSEAILSIKRGLGFRQTQDTAIIAALKEAQRNLEAGKTLPNWLVEYDAPIPVTSGTNTIALPTGFIRLHDDYDLYRVSPTAGNVTIKRRRFDEAYEAFVASGDEDDSAVVPVAGSYPQVFTLLNKLEAILIPTPMVSFTAYLSFYKGAALLDSDIENAWLKNAPDYLIGLAGMTVAGNLRDKDALSEFTRRAKLSGAGMMGDIIEDELAGRPLILGRNN